MSNGIRFIVILSLAVAFTAFTYPQLKNLSDQRQANLKSKVNEVLFLPNGQALQVLSFDYKILLANLLWFNTVSYFGKHYRGDRNYTWLNHMCNLVIDLDPKAEHVFEFCSLMLSWELEQPSAAIALLSKAITTDPDKWRYYYLRGVTQAFFLQDMEAAHRDFSAGASTSQAPIFLTRMASKTLSGLDSPDAAVKFLKSMVSRSTNPAEKEALEKHLKQTIHDFNISQLESKVLQLPKEARTSELKLEELISDFKNYRDPFGGTYYWDVSSGKIKSTSGVARGKSLVNKSKSKKTIYKR